MMKKKRLGGTDEDSTTLESPVAATTDKGGTNGPGDDTSSKGVLDTITSFVSRKENDQPSSKQINGN